MGTGAADYTVRLVDDNGDADMSVAVVGDQVVDLTGATPGEVLTIQADGTVAPAPGGGVPPGTYVDVPAGTPTVGQVPVVTDDSPLTFGWGEGGAVDSVDGQTGDVDLSSVYAALADLAPLSDNTPQEATYGVGSAGSSNEAMRADAVIPLPPFTLPQPLLLAPEAVDESAVEVSALTSQTAPTQVWKGSDGVVTAGIHPGNHSGEEGGFGFPQVAGFPRFHAVTHGATGRINCTGIFFVEQPFFLVGTSNQAAYRNDGFSLKNGDINVDPFSSGANARMNMTAGAGWIMPSARLTSDLWLDERASDPAAQGDAGVVFCKDNGSGKTQLCVRFGTGAVQVLATEP